MNVFVYVDNIMQLITYLACGGTLITAILLRFASIRNALTIHGVTCVAIAKWHYWAGWMTIVGFVFSKGISVGKIYIAPLKSEHFIHAVLSICCVRFVFAKVKRIRRAGISQKHVWDMRFFVFGAIFVITTCLAVALRMTNLEMLMVQQNFRLFQIMLLGHIATAVMLIWFGYLLISNDEYGIDLDKSYRFDAKG